MGLRRTALSMLACGFISVAASANGQNWSLVESGSTRVFTNSSPDLGARVLQELAATQSLLKQVASVELALPLDVFVVKDGQSLSEFAPKQFKRGDIHTFGFSHTGAHASFIAVRADRPEADMLGTLRHEYVHAVTAAQPADTPSWLDEGLADFWGAASVAGDRVAIGRPIARHLELLRRGNWLPLSAVLKQPRGSLPASPDKVRMFYAQSWAMVHYLLLGPHRDGLGGFMPQARESSLPSDADLRRYIAGADLREVSMPWRPARTVAPRALPIPESRALAERANMLVSGSELNGALAAARRALAINPNEALALEVIGTYYFLNNEPEQARAWLGRSLGVRVTYPAALYLSLLSTAPADRERYLMLAVLSRPASEIAWQRLGSIFEQDGRLEIARRWCRSWSSPLLSGFLSGPTTSFCAGGPQ